MKTKIRCYDDGATDFHIRKMHEAGCNHICFLLISIDSVSKKDENYYLKICNYIEKIRWWLKFWSDESSESDEASRWGLF